MGHPLRLCDARQTSSSLVREVAHSQGIRICAVRELTSAIAKPGFYLFSREVQLVTMVSGWAVVSTAEFMMNFCPSAEGS